MIIKLPLMLHNIVSKQFKISHVPCDVIAFKKEDIPANILKLISDQYDEKFLEDCDTVLFIKGPIDKDMRKKIFKAADKALGEGANMMNEQDFRLLKLHDDDSADFGGEEDASEEEKIDKQVNDIVDEPDDDNVDDSKDDADDGLEDNEDAVGKTMASESIEDNSISSAVVQGKAISQWAQEFKGEFSPSQLWKMANSGTDLQRLLLTINGDCTLDDSELNEAKEEDEDDKKKDEEDAESKEDDNEEDSSDEDSDDDSSDDNEEDEPEKEEKPAVPTRYVFLKISMKG